MERQLLPAAIHFDLDQLGADSTDDAVDITHHKAISGRMRLDALAFCEVFDRVIHVRNVGVDAGIVKRQLAAPYTDFLLALPL